MSNHWILGELAKSYAQEEREKAMTTDEYDQLLEDVRTASRCLDEARHAEQVAIRRLERVMEVLSKEESRIAQQALTSMHSASRKLVVGE